MALLHVKLIFGLALVILSFPIVSSAQAKNTEPYRAPESYRIRQGDKIGIKFFSHPELNELSLLVRPDGFVSPQIINEIRAEGRTVAELKTELEKAYNETLLTPIITVSIVEFVTPRIFVGGQIHKPGRYDIREAGTLVQAVFLAGGFTPDARRSMVIHARPNGRGEWQIRTANVLKMLDPRGTEKDLTLRDGDYIFVPDSKMSQINKIMDTVKGFLPRVF